MKNTEYTENEDYLENEYYLENEDNLENEDDLENEYSIKERKFLDGYSFWDNYPNFNGRIHRCEYFTITIALNLGLSILYAICFPLGLIVWIGTLPYMLSLMAKRLHDSGKSAWFLLTIFIWPIFIVLMIMPGNEGENEYGEEPVPFEVKEDDQNIFQNIFFEIKDIIITAIKIFCFACLFVALIGLILFYLK